MVEIIVEKDAEVKYSTVQNWYPGDKQGRGGIYNFVTKRGICRENARLSWTQVRPLGHHLEIPRLHLAGDNSVGEFYSVAMTNNFQQADTVTKMIRIGRNTPQPHCLEYLGGAERNSYRGLVRHGQGAENAPATIRSATRC